ncbi:MAG: lipo-like protein [Luteimonas sp.]
MQLLSTPLSLIGTALARYLSRPAHVHGAAPATPLEVLKRALRPGDVLLVEGHSLVSTAIKYLTQSTWSHAALYVGDQLAELGGNPQHCFVEADIVEGVRSVGPGEFAGYHTRICRPVGLDDDACRRITRYAIDRIGSHYDLRNVFDLARYLLPTPPVPSAMRRRMLALGSGDPTRAICSTLIAQAFQSVRYPILPVVLQRDAATAPCPGCLAEALHIRHHSLFAPRDFDVSPYFAIIKPLLTADFDYRSLQWDALPGTATHASGHDVHPSGISP